MRFPLNWQVFRVSIAVVKKRKNEKKGLKTIDKQFFFIYIVPNLNKIF